MTYSKLARSGVSALALGLYLASTPVTVDFHLAGDGIVRLIASLALAKDGRDDDDDRSGKSERSGRDDDNDRSGKSERSGRDDDEDDDRGGSGGRGGDDRDDDDDDDDDRSGSGSGRNDDRNEDRSGRRGGDDDDHDDDRRGRGRGSDDGPAGGVSTAVGAGGLRVVNIEESGSGLEIVYSNGIKEEIEGGRYELKNAAGRTVIQRTATAADRARIESNVVNSGVSTSGNAVAASRQAPRVPSGSQVRRVEIGTQSVEVSYSGGWREQVEGNRYELKDPNNNTVVERRATQADVDRLMSLGR
jgi:hypothetical protein